MTQTTLTRTIPAEWAPQAALWTAWPSHPDLWLDNLEAARAEVAAMITAAAKGETVKLLAMGDEALASAKKAVGDCAEIVPARFGDIWLRDTGPIFNAAGEALRFKTNGWGGKYELPHDDTVADQIAERAGAPVRAHDFVLEGGALEHNGAGTILTTRQCVLNPNRNPGWTQQKAEQALLAAFGAKRILWLDDGLMNDHTDGHIDNVARFVTEKTVLCQRAFGPDDPNAETFKKTARDLAAMGLDVVQIPSPGRVSGEDGAVVPASHMNFIITNKAVIVPSYGAASGEEAAAAIGAFFPGRETVLLPSSALLTGGGSFHCITQQEPAL